MPLTLSSCCAALRPARSGSPRLATLALTLLLTPLLSACSIRGYALRSVADALASGDGGGLAEEEDIELAKDAAAFGLKTMEKLSKEVPDHRGLYLALGSGFTQYGYAFVQQDADVLEDKDIKRAQTVWLRVRRLYLRGRDYALRGLSQGYAGFGEAVLSNSPERRRAALARLKKADVPLLYWAGAAWALAISNAKTDANLVGDLPAVEDLMERALALDEGYDQGALHEFFVSYDPSRPEPKGGNQKAKEHLDRAVQLDGGRRLGVQVAYAEGVLVAKQERALFTKMLQDVLAVDILRDEPAWRAERLPNVVAQQRARWLLAKIDDLFAN